MIQHRYHLVAATIVSASLFLCVPATNGEPGQDLSDKDFTGKDLSGQDFSGANLSDSTLKNAKLEKTNLQGANLTDADLTGATLAEADLTGANLQDAIISNAYFARAILTKANLKGTKKINISSIVSLRGADLRKVELTGGASGIDFREADLRGSKLTDVYSLKDARIKRAKCDPTTRWPSDFDPQEAGLVLAADEPAAEPTEPVGDATSPGSKPAIRPIAPADGEVSAGAGATAKKPETAAAKPDTKALTSALESFLVMLDNGQYDESFDATAPSFREGLTKASWAANLKPNRASLGKPTARSATRVDTNTDLTSGKKTYVVPVASKFEKGAVIEEVTLVEDGSGQFRVSDYSITTSR